MLFVYLGGCVALEEFVVTVSALLRCIASSNVPMVLKKQSHQIPNDLEKFLSAVRDMEKWFEYKKDFKQLFEGYAEAKENILTCIDTFNLSGHP